MKHASANKKVEKKLDEEPIHISLLYYFFKNYQDKFMKN